MREGFLVSGWIEILALRSRKTWIRNPALTRPARSRFVHDAYLPENVVNLR